MNSTPSVLYKYRSLSGESFKFTQDIILRNRLYKAPASTLNDMGEGTCLPRLPSHLRGKTSNRSDDWAHGNYGWGMQIRLSQSCGKYSIISFTENPSDQLMWSYYADSHKGICIGFSSTTCPDIANARAVQYRSSPPTWEGEDNDLLENVYFAKSKEWEHEKEWRISDFQTGFLSLSVGAISEIILGARIAPSDEDWVMEWLRLKGIKPKVYRSKSSDREYKMKVQPI